MTRRGGRTTRAIDERERRTAHAAGDERRDMVSAYTKWVLGHRFIVIAIALLVFALCTFGTQYLVLDDNYRMFFDEDNEELVALETLEDMYGREEVLLFILTPEDGDVFTQDVLTAVAQLTEDAWQIPYTTRVDSITNFQHTESVEDDIVIEDLVDDPSSLDEAALERIREIATTEPLLVNRILSPTGHITAVSVTVILPGEGAGERVGTMRKSRELVADLEEAHPDIDAILSGGVVISYAFQEYSEGDLALLTPLMHLVVILFIAIMLRSFWATVASTLVIIMAEASALGLAGWANLHLTAPTSSVPIIVVTLAVADCIHLLIIFLAQMRKGDAKDAAIAESLRVNLGPIFVTSLTTCLGFLSMNLNDVPPLRDFGNMTAMGVAAAFLFSVTFLPAILSLLPIRVKQRPDSDSEAMAKLADWVISKQRPLLIGGVAVVTVLALFLPRNDFRNNWLNWFKASTQFRADAEYISENFTGINALEFSIASSGPGGVSDPEYLQALDDFASWIRQQDHVHHASTLADVIKRLNMNMHGDDASYYRIPEDRELAAQYLLLYEMSLPYGQDLNNQINVDKSATRVTVIIDQIDSTLMNEMGRESEEWFVTNGPAYMRTHSTGTGPIFASIAESTIRSMVRSTPIALLVVSLTLVFAFRSLRYGLLSLIPNLVPIVMAFGIWGLVVGRINFGVACVAALSIGIVVDDTVHFVSKYLRGRREHGHNAEDAIRYAFTSVGKALWTTSLILFMGFTVMMFSSFNFNANMGILTALTIVLALASDVLLLPPILLFFDKKSVGTTKENEV